MEETSTPADDAAGGPPIDGRLPGDDGSRVDGSSGPPLDGSPDLAAPPPDGAPVATCGNGKIESGEECDPPGTCPTSCPAKGCTRFTLQGAADKCTARCVEAAPQTACAPGDGCCPTGCNAGNDSDCAIKCDNGVIEGQETCDPLSSCPTSCPAQGCQLRKLINAGTCSAQCVNDRQQTACASGDGCCPSACNSANDSDCSAKCGNGVIEGGETCDPVSSCLSKQSTCVSDKDTVRTPSGDPSSCTFACAETARTCGAADGQCPTGCAATADPDCRKAQGSSCNTAGECKSGACVDKYCCDQSCGSTCYACSKTRTGQSNGTCAPVSAGLDSAGACTAAQASTCQTDGKCDGSGSCEMWGSSVSCGTLMCSGTDIVAAGHCSGQGSCSRPAPTTCAGAFVCRANACLRSCGSDSDCVASATCFAQSCLDRCRNPSASNVVTSPGFDTPGTLWPGAPNAVFSTSDAVNCATSGSMELTTDSNSPCFPVSPSTLYFFGFMVKSTMGGGGCAIDFSPDLNTCMNGFNSTNVVLFGQNSSWAQKGWQFQSDPDSHYASIYCSDAPSSGTYVDMFYVNSARAEF
jgi:hypothetical protein